MATIGIIGGGISGLASAHFLLKFGKESIRKIFIIEASKTVGGFIKSSKFNDGTVFEHGPRSMRYTRKGGDDIINMVEELNLGSEVLPITPKHSPAMRRYLFVDNKLCDIHFGQMLFITTSPFKKPLIVSAFRDIFKKRKTCVDDSLYDFAERRFGKEVAEYLVDAFARGIFAGDARLLSVKAFSKSFFDAEQKYGSVIRGLRKMAKETEKETQGQKGILLQRAASEQWTMWNLKDGLQTLTDRLKEELEKMGVVFHLNTTVAKLDFSSQCPNIITNNDVSYECDHIISALPAKQLGNALDESLSPIVKILEEIKPVSVGVVTLEFQGAPKDVLPKQGFGFLIPSCENIPILGIIFDSCVFPQHDGGKDDRTRLSVMMGGQWMSQYFGDPRELSLTELYDVAVYGVKTFLGVTAPILRHQTHLHHNCIPQYTVGHFERVDRLRKYITEGRLPLSLVGSSYNGIGVPDCVSNAKTQVTSYVNKC